MRDYRIEDCGRAIDGVVEHPLVSAFGMLIPDDGEPDYLFIGEGEGDDACASWPLPEDWRVRLIVGEKGKRKS